MIKLQKEATDLKKEREELTKMLKNLEKDKSTWQKQSDELNNLKKDQSSIKKDKDALSQNLKTMEKELKKFMKDVQPKKVCVTCGTVYFYVHETSKYCPSVFGLLYIFGRVSKPPNRLFVNLNTHSDIFCSYTL